MAKFIDILLCMRRARQSPDNSTGSNSSPEEKKLMAGGKENGLLVNDSLSFFTLCLDFIPFNQASKPYT